MRRRVSKLNSYPPAHSNAWKCTGAQSRRLGASCSTWSSSCFARRPACGSTAGGTSCVFCRCSLCMCDVQYPDLLVLTTFPLLPAPPSAETTSWPACCPLPRPSTSIWWRRTPPCRPTRSSGTYTCCTESPSCRRSQILAALLPLLLWLLAPFQLCMLLM